MMSPTWGDEGSTKRRRYSISLSSKMGDKGEGEVKNLKKLVTSFMDGPYYNYTPYLSHCRNSFTYSNQDA